MHKSVLLQETIKGLALKEGNAVIDATVGAGGHSKEILKMIERSGKLLAVDKDKEALSLARSVLKGDNITFSYGNFAEIETIAKENDFQSVDAIIADLGASSMQFDNPERGFSFSKSGKLDMRMDKSQKISAYEVVNNYSEKELGEIIKEYGEEKKFKVIARKIIEERKRGGIVRTDQLAEVVGGAKGKKTRIDPATKVFQAIRIEVNKELLALESALPQMVSLLCPGGRIAIISFHSLEDRIVKRFFQEKSKNCVCPPEFPECKCNTRPSLKIITKKPIMPKEEEIRENKRSRSAKLRVAEKV